MTPYVADELVRLRAGLQWADDVLGGWQKQMRVHGDPVTPDQLYDLRQLVQRALGWGDEADPTD